MPPPLSFCLHRSAVWSCFLLNGGFGLLFGRLYRRYGIQYAMLSHALLHIVSKTVWTLFL